MIKIDGNLIIVKNKNKITKNEINYIKSMNIISIEDDNNDYRIFVEKKKSPYIFNVEQIIDYIKKIKFNLFDRFDIDNIKITSYPYEDDSIVFKIDTYLEIDINNIKSSIENLNEFLGFLDKHELKPLIILTEFKYEISFTISLEKLKEILS